ncbi:MAG TPA: chromosome segregation protein SMC [Candidatus Nanoarchaeia archaeon]|nr:chromosome segregation protein SMC [Candidatus Nanoarchaeia archaeon]
MTIIQKIVARGFKSFSKHTELVFGNDYNCILGPNGSGKSCHYDTLVQKDDGSEVKIGELVEEQINKNQTKTLDDGIYCDNKEEIKLISLNPNSMKSEAIKVSKFIKREGEPYLYEIKVNSGKKVKTTGCHPLIVFRNGKIVSSLARDLKENDLIATPRIIFTSSNSNDKDFARLFGYVIGDGYINYYMKRIEFVNKDKEIIKDYKNLIKKLFNIGPKYEKITNGITRIMYYQKDFVNKVINLIKNNENKYTSEFKYIPDNFLNNDLETVSNILAGLFDTDGTIDKNKAVVEFCSKNEKLVNQIQRLLLRFNIIARKKARLCKATNTINKTEREYYYLYIEGYENIKKFYINIPLRCIYKKERLEQKLRINKTTNPNLDILPKETNLLIKRAVKLLGIKAKYLSKQYPKLTAYIDNRCNPTRQGINEILPILSNKLLKIYYAGLGLKKDQFNLVEVMDELYIPGRQVSLAIGLSKTCVRDRWATGQFTPRTKNLDAFFNFIQSAITSRVSELKDIMNTLYSLANSDIFWDRITSINKIKGEEYVYDLTIPNNHNFIGNGIFVHNSNVADSLCFVLGKSSAKSLRAERSSHLIYNGGKKHPPAKEAEVSIFFDNSKKEFPISEETVKISRIVKQSGNSVYKINDKTMTRQQVVDLLSAAKIDPDGHNIILQGDIVNFIQMRPEDRRLIIEEIAGISIYEDKKFKALQELEKVDQRVNEANIILTEREANLRELKKDRDQAKKYKDLQDRIKDNKATFLHIQIKEKEEKRNETEKRLTENQSKVDNFKKSMEEIRSLIQTNKDEILNITKEIEEKGEKEQIILRSQIDELKTSIIKNQSRLETLQNEIKKIEERKSQLKNNINDLNSQITSLKEQRKDFENNLKSLQQEEDSLKKDINSFKEKHQISEVNELKNKINNIEKNVEFALDAQQKLHEEKQSIIRERDKAEFHINDIDLKLSKLTGSKSENIDKLRQEFKKISVELSRNLNDDSSLSAQLSNARKKYNESSDELSRLNAQHIGIKETVSHDSSIKRILSLNQSGIHGTLSQLGEVPSKYSLALEVAAGQRINSIVVESEVIASKCISLLKEEKLGIATFLPLNKLNVKQIPNEHRSLSKSSGVHGFAIDLIKFNPKFKDAFIYALSSTLVVDNLDIARRIGIGKIRMVTIEGDLIEPTGAMIGGHRRKMGIGFSQKEISSDIGKIENELSRLKSIIVRLEEKKNESESIISTLRNKKAEFEGEILKLEKSMGIFDTASLSEDKQSLQKQLKEHDNKIKDIDKELYEIQKDIENFKKQRDSFRDNIISPDSSKALSSLEENKTIIREKVLSLNSDINSINTNIEKIFLPEIEKTNKILNDIEKEKFSFSNEFKDLNEIVKNKQNDLKNLERKEKEYHGRSKSLIAKRDKIQQDIQKKESLIMLEDEKQRNFFDKINNLSIERAKFIAELEALQREYEQYSDGTLRRGVPIDELKSEIKDFEKLISDLGNVNLRALEIYEKLEIDHKEMVEKVDKLKLEKDDVLKMIQEIEEKKKDIFMQTYKEINKSFQDIFSQLSTKGEASLDLEDKDNILKTGVEIKVRITGNKFLDIKSLSGGEKTMAALALIFAIQEYDPASFYLLDEVDAALDKSNSEKLSKLIAKYSTRAQYIVISHNDTIISEANQIYGVSMQDGQSKVVSLKV